MKNKEIALLLRHVAAALSITDEKKYRFQIIAYQNAAASIENSTVELSDLHKENRLNELPGVGSSLQSYLQELLQTGKVGHFETILSKIPATVFPLLSIPSFGPKKAYKLVTALSLNDASTVIDDLESFGKKGEIAPIEGFGEKSQEVILQAITEYKLGRTKELRMPLPFAAELADTIISYLNQLPEVQAAYSLGSLRRMRETIGDIDIAVITDTPSVVLQHFTAYPYAQRILQSGKNEASLLISGGQRVDLRTESKKGFGALLQHFTGSKAHNVHLRELAIKKGLSLSEYGITDAKTQKLTAYDSEEKFYQAIGLDFIEPELREDTGEIEVALSHSLPPLVKTEDIKGDFHLHSKYPIEPSHDLGRNSFQEMIDTARQLGYEYLGFSEHNPSVSKHTQKEVYTIITQRKSDLTQIQLSNKDIRIFSLLETDILTSGELGIDNESLELLDATIVSIHSAFDMNKSKMTERVLKGLSHKKAKILAHPTGRLINKRLGFDLDWDKVFEYCVKNYKALEINASPHRLDLPDTLVKRAVGAGVKFFINTDSHAVDQMSLMKYGVSVARRGWAPKEAILNTWEYPKLSEWFDK